MTQKTFPFPGVLTTTDGSGAVVWVDTHISDGACAYPITPSTPMGQGYQVEVSNGAKNLWGVPLVFLELESEHSAASTCEGFALAGGRVSNFTSGQGLVLMKEVLYTISGKRLPAVFHIGARALTSHSLNVHAGHDDVMAVADCGWGMVFAKNAQEAGDLALICRRAAEDSETPFFNVQDGFLTTHTTENVLLCEEEFMREFVGDPKSKLRNYMDPAHPLMSGVVQNQDSYMKGKVAQRFFYDKVPMILQQAMDEFHEKTGRRYNPVESYRMDDAEYALVGMGSAMETAMATVDFLRSERGIKVGVVNVTVFRPFPGPQLVQSLSRVKALSVLERMDNPLAQSNPLAAELKAAFSDALTKAPGYPAISAMPVIFAGAGGLGSRDVRPGDCIAIVENMQNGQGKRTFVIGIDHPLAIHSTLDPDVRPAGAFSMRGHSVGGYGSITTNKVIASISEDLFEMWVQAYPKYGSEKKGLPTTYYLTLANDRVRTHCELNQVEFVPLNDVNAFSLGNPLSGLSEGGMLFIQTSQTTPETVWASIPDYAKKIIRERKIRVLALDTVAIAREVATSPDLIQRMQGIVLLGIFLKVTPFSKQKGLSREEILEGVEKSLRKYFGKRGERVVQDNLLAVKRGFNEVIEIPAEIIGAAKSAVSGAAARS
ncbi:MAG: 2-oxoacid:acceptor oxidoreductase family protein [Armatimonadetes bacterium]|nr:2-oxoacid:acceptor oxidoreductase family protein [Armatimonadota bacterium]